MGEKTLPDSAYYGIQTLRAVENFPISGWKPWPEFVDATVHIKRAAAIVNRELGQLDPKIADAIVMASDEILGGELRDQFVVDVYQAGAGTSHNMNANEVLANRACELLGSQKGDQKLVSPNDHVNRAQSTNDVIPTAIRVMARLLLPSLLAEMKGLEDAFREKSKEYWEVLKSGRTHLQDAVPVTLGQEFLAYADIVKEHVRRVEAAAEDCLYLGIGGTATGTGLNAHPQYQAKMCDQLAKHTGAAFKPSSNLMEAMQSMAPFTTLSGALRNFAADLYKMTTDLRLMDSGPFTGISEIQMPPVQPGSSIMPGKVNPVLCEMTAMVCFQVFGTDLTIANAAQAGNFELNVMMPVIAFNLGLEMRILTTACNALQTKCIRGIKANAEKCEHYAESTLMLVTALSPHIGYLKAADVAKECLKTGKTIRQVTLEWNLMPADKLDEVLDLRKMANLNSKP